MSFIFGGLATEAYDRGYSDGELVRRIAAYMRPHARRLLVVTLALLTLAVLSAAFPVLVARGVDRLAVGGGEALLIRLVAFILAIGVLVWGLNYVRFRGFATLIGDIVLQMRSDALSAAVRHDLSFYDEHRSGRVISRVTSDTHEFGQTMRLVGDVLNQMAVVLVLMVVLFGIEWRLASLQLVLSPLVFYLVQGWRRIARKATRQGTRAMANVNAAIQEAVTGISVAKNFRQEAAIYEEFSAVNSESYRINFRRGLVLSTVFPVLNALSGIGVALILYAGGRAVGIDVISAGAWYLFVSTVDRFWFPMMQLAAFWSQFQGGLAAAERVFALIDAEPSVLQTAEDTFTVAPGGISFEGVDFYYSENEPVLRDFSLQIEPGESLALVGHTGAGKSSLFKLLARFYEFQGGVIRVGGHDVRRFQLRQYRRQLGIVSQSPFLFPGTVADNICYACPGASADEILAVARRIGEGEWLQTLPDGLQTDVGERGARLSLGQRQLVALTRVLLQAPAVFLLDEATASVDPFTESQIQEALDLILQERTSILIAHRLSTVRSADRIIVLREGEIIEQGSHGKLMAAGGHYAELYDTYFRHQSLQYIEREAALSA
ncbi:MAG TPA: ABC transporter ATP-binding protein [Anaerolineales bacterium]|jgi:ATP-binding cassette subfamily B protein|nr:ABC transporter ATP-binding protein [Anaerolineales bacterium]